MTHDPRGSLWYRWDLHFHTPSSFDYGDKSVTNQQLVDRLIAENIRVVAITDHHVIDVERIRQLQKLGEGKLTILPGMELRGDHGGKPINYISIFPENCDLDHVWTTLQGKLELTTKAIADRGGHDKIYVPIEQGAEATRNLGGIVSIHAGAKTNSIEGISNYEQFQQRIKYDITKKWVDVMEIGQLKDIDAHHHIIFPITQLERPLAICSDNHDIKEYSIKAPLWFRADPTFRGLLMVLREPRDRVFIGTRPDTLTRVEQHPTKYIRQVSFDRKDTAPDSDRWFSGSIEFNPGLVAIVGNKGSGKSALADTLGLLGATKNSASFSFLSDKRFLHPISGQAQHFSATVEWEAGDPITRELSDTIEPEEVERVKYLPQDHVEKVCNELVGIGEEGFEKELKGVIFSHVPEPQQLGHGSLDALVDYQAGEKQKRIDSLIKQLRELCRVRVQLEAQADPVVKRELREQVKRRELELEAHLQTKPPVVANPAADPASAPPDAALVNDLTTAETEKVKLSEDIATATTALGREERRLAVAKKLLEKLNNFQKDFDVFREGLDEEAGELGLKVDALITLSISTTAAEKVVDEADKRISDISAQLDTQDPPGLRLRLSTLDARIVELQSKLDAPNRAFQTYLKELTAWEERRVAIEGTEDEPDSLKGLKKALVALDEIPAKITATRDKQIALSLDIHSEKLAQAEVYRKFYGPVQSFIDTHDIAKDKLKLEFRAELTNEGFVTRLLTMLALNRRGSFMGIDEGRTQAEKYVSSTKWEDRESVKAFLTSIDTALHVDQRENPPSPVKLKDQLVKGTTQEEVFNFIYGMDYVRPRYILRWEGKDLSMLSPGERGTLLLVFYLLIDKGDIPLLMDQPEGNLDNHTVAKILVDCIKEARKKRQVFIITHNPNLAVVCDADQIVYASMDKSKGNEISYVAGALENPAMSTSVTDVLEGTRWAFRVRDGKYKVGEE